MKRILTICLLISFVQAAFGNNSESLEETHIFQLTGYAEPIEVGSNLQLQVTSNYSTAPSGATFTWSSNNTSVATVTSNGLVTAVSEGSTTITCVVSSSNSQFFAPQEEKLTCTITVKKKSVISFADAEVKRICVENWDTDGDDELSFDEAAAVTSIGEVFKKNIVITSFNEFKYFENVEVIDQRAFEGCYELSSISMPRRIHLIGDRSFVSCSKLLYIDVTDLENWCGITFPNGSSTPFRNGCHLLVNGEEIINLVIPDGITSISKWAFQHCSNIETIQLPNSLETISWSAFGYCSKLQAITIPESVTSIDEYAFFNCTSLKSFFLPKNVTALGNSVLSGCSALTSIVVEDGNPNYDSRNNCNAIIKTSTNTLLAGCKNTVIPNDIQHLGNSIFAHCEDLETIDIPNSIESFGHSVFTYTNLTTLVVPEKVIEIPSSLCWECKKLTTIVLPAGITSIDNTAFRNCPLSSVTVKINTPLEIDN